MEVEEFNNQGFELWKLKMGYILANREHWIVVDLDTKHTNMSKEDYEKMERKVRSIIWL